MIIAFTLSMPSNNSWDGKWSGADRLHVIVKSFRQIPKHDDTPIAPGRYSYDFGDGWRARVVATIVDRSTANKLRRRSVGFSGYDWMVDEIICLGRIRILAEHIVRGRVTDLPE